MSVRRKPKANYRYSIVPAGAITDPTITPRDLQVLCLLGRHVDDLGWCRRSQVTMGEELNCDRRTIQRALDRLIDAGYVQKKAEGKGRLAAPVEGERPFAAHSYRVVLDLDRDDREADGAQICARGVRSAAQDVRTSSAHGVRIKGAHPKEHTPLEHTPSKPEAHAREGEREGGSDAAGKKKRRYSDPFERIWTEILKWPGFNRDLVSKPEVLAAFLEVEAELPPTGTVVAIARSYGQGLARDNEHRAQANRRRPDHPARWFRNRHWDREGEFIAPPPDEPIRPTTISSEHVARLRLAGLEDPVIAQWFGDGEFDEGPPTIFRAASQFKGDWIAQRFGAQLERAFGTRVLVTVKQERAA